MTLTSMLKARVALTAFVSLPVFIFLAFMRHVVVKMTGNAAFTTPIPALTAVTTALDDLETKATKAQNGSKEDRALRDVSWATALDYGRRLAVEAQEVVQG